MFNNRKKYSKKEYPAKNNIYKLLLNSLYGKFATEPELMNYKLEMSDVNNNKDIDTEFDVIPIVEDANHILLGVSKLKNNWKKKVYLIFKETEIIISY